MLSSRTSHQQEFACGSDASTVRGGGAFMKVRGFHLVVALAACLLAATHAFAQGGGASSTGSINGKVSDSSGGVLPGVTVSATSPSMMGVQSSVSDSGGNYCFPGLPP